MTAGRVRVDHLVVAAPTLAAGEAWCRSALGITPGPGGRHPLMGTHNRLFRIDGPGFAEAYFEIIAIDPDAPPPARARWFGLDAIDLGAGPRLVQWSARCADLDASAAALRDAGFDPGPAVAATRETPQGRLAWRLTVRDDGEPLAGGALPTLIEWASAHPSASMPPSGVELRSLTLRGLSPGAEAALAAPGIEFARDPGPALSATLAAPIGLVTLHSRVATPAPEPRR